VPIPRSKIVAQGELHDARVYQQEIGDALFWISRATFKQPDASGLQLQKETSFAMAELCSEVRDRG
jgi:hypothetical protein